MSFKILRPVATGSVSAITLTPASGSAHEKIDDPVQSPDGPIGGDYITASGAATYSADFTLGSLVPLDAAVSRIDVFVYGQFPVGYATGDLSADIDGALSVAIELASWTEETFVGWLTDGEDVDLTAGDINGAILNLSGNLGEDAGVVIHAAYVKVTYTSPDTTTPQVIGGDAVIFPASGLKMIGA